MISFIVRTIPVAKARHRSFVSRQGHVRSYQTSDAQKAESEFMALADPYAPPEPLDGGIELRLTFVLPIPQSMSKRDRELVRLGIKHHTKKGDLDNYIKLVADCLTRSGRWWHDDSQIVRLMAEKTYGSAPETRVEVIPLNASSRTLLEEVG